MTSCVFSGNTGSSAGGIENYSENGPISVSNCTLTGNTATTYGGGGMENDIGFGPITLTNCTLTDNTAPSGYGGGINNFADATNGAALTLSNDIIYGDTGGEVTQYESSTANILVTYCDIQGGYAGTGNIGDDPLLANKANGDVHLRPGSPCIGAGTASGAPTTDKDGTNRPTPPSIGAYELGSTLTVPGQYSTIQAAINAANNGNAVLISDGTYTGPGNVDLDFGGKNITVTSVYGPATTIIDCRGTSSANHRGFYLHSGETSAFISGLTIENGYESGVDGGGVLNLNANMTVQNCILKDNIASNGGGICNSGSGLVALVDCTFTGNTANTGSGGGGGLSNYATSSGSVAIINCILTGNTASGDNSSFGGEGGGIRNSDEGSGAITVTNCTLTGNSAGAGNGTGGGIRNYNPGSGTISVINCSLTGNSAPGGNGGGGFYNDNEGIGSITVTNCALTGNTAGTSGGGFYNYASSGTIRAIGCSLTKNTASTGAGVYNNNSGGTITLTNDILYGDTGSEIWQNYGTVTYSDVQGGYTGTGNIDADPLFVKAPTNLHLQYGSPCLGAGTRYYGAPPNDIDGKTRPNPPSIGAYDAALTTTALISSLNPSIVGQSVTFTVTVAGGGGTPT